VIGTVSADQRAIIRGIRELHMAGLPFELDATYGHGVFWKGTDAPRWRADLNPLPGVNVLADCRELPFPSRSLSSVMFDPPFNHAHGAASPIGQRYGSYRTQAELQGLYGDAIAEFGRVLRPGGVLAAKCMDCVESGRQHANHVHVYNEAIRRRFECLDLFVLTRSRVMVGWNHRGRQRHARKHHCFFWVFRKLPMPSPPPTEPAHWRGR